MAIITLTTDFGTRDGYVGAVKGVIARIAPGATIVDIAHDIPPGDIVHAAWVVATSTLEFPHETIHVVVVDPGVGGERQGVIARVPANPPRGVQYYVGPDNGVFAYLLVDKAWRIERRDVLAPTISSTFHGRDVFAHVAAGLANERDPLYFGSRTKLTGALPWGPRAAGTGRVVHIDQFGNLITDLPAAEAASGAIVVDARRMPVTDTYASVGPGELLAYVGSAGTVELAVRDGRADHELGLRRGHLVAVAPVDPNPQGPYR